MLYCFPFTYTVMFWFASALPFTVNFPFMYIFPPTYAVSVLLSCNWVDFLVTLKYVRFAFAA